MIAGSKWNFLANSGSVQPINLEIMIVATRESDTTIAREISLYIRKIRSPFARARKAPTSKETRNSLNIILKMSLNSNSSSARPRMINVELWEPQFPPVSINIGMKDTRSGTAANAFSYFVMIIPVNVAEIIRTRSQTIRFLACSNTLASKYPFSLGVTAAHESHIFCWSLLR